MDWMTGLQRAIDYIEENLDGDIEYAEAARQAYSSEYHFQRAFLLITGMTLGEYIRRRRLTLASADLRAGAKVIDVALKYGYDSPDSFARALSKFRGVLPTDARRPGTRLNSCSRLLIQLTLEGGTMLEYRIENRPVTRLLGFRRHFEGAPYGEDRDRQEEQLMTSTRAHQYMLRGMTDEIYKEIVALSNFNDEGYDFWYLADVDDWTRAHLYDQKITRIDFMDQFGFESLTVPGGAYVVFRTPSMRSPVPDYHALRLRIAREGFPTRVTRCATHRS